MNAKPINLEAKVIGSAGASTSYFSSSPVLVQALVLDAVLALEFLIRHRAGIDGGQSGISRKSGPSMRCGS